MKPASRDAIDRWMNAGLRQVTLPTGTRMKLRIPAAEQLIRHNVMPQDLRELAVKFASTGLVIEELTPDDLEQFLKMKQVLVAWSIREIYAGDAPITEKVADDDPAWQPIEISADEIDAAEIDADDLGALTSIVLRQRTPNEVTAVVWADIGKLERGSLDEQLRSLEAEDEGETVGRFRDVRADERGADARADGGDVGLPPESDGRDPRSRRGARVR